MAANEINVSESVDVKMQADLDKALEKVASLQKEVDAANKKASSFARSSGQGQSKGGNVEIGPS